jgi:hypothetical protein
LFGPTEVRIYVSAILVAEVLIKDFILYASVVACVLLFIVNIIDTIKLLKLASDRDMIENK